MQKRILSNNGHSQSIWHDHGDGRVTVQQVTDVTAAVERAKGLHNIGAHTTGMGDKHVASVPIPVLTAWAQERGKTYADVLQDSGLLKQFLEDPDNGVFRVWKGRL